VQNDGNIFKQAVQIELCGVAQKQKRNPVSMQNASKYGISVIHV